jgi:hypothetical protein
MVQRRSQQSQEPAEDAGPVAPEDRKWRGTPLRDLPDAEIDVAINYCLGMLSALWTVRQKRRNEG